jgi:hypothetical protein
MSRAEVALLNAHTQVEQDRFNLLKRRAEIDAELARLDADKADLEQAYESAIGKPIPAKDAVRA